MDTYIFPIGSITDTCEVFSVDECVACQLVVEKALISINSGLRCGSQDVIAHENYAGISLLHIVVVRFSLWDLLC